MADFQDLVRVERQAHCSLEEHFPEATLAVQYVHRSVQQAQHLVQSVQPSVHQLAQPVQAVQPVQLAPTSAAFQVEVLVSVLE